MKYGKIIGVAVGSFLLGLAIAVVVIVGLHHNARIKRLEINQNELIARQRQIVGAINQSRTPTPGPQIKAVEKAENEKD